MDIKREVMNRVREHYKKMYDEFGNRLVGVFLIGSQNYELDIESSDVDTIAIVIPSISEIAFLSPPYSTTIVVENEEHIVIKDLRLVRYELHKGSPNMLEILFTDYCVLNPNWWEFSRLIAHRERIARISPAGVVNAWIGIARRHIKKYKEDIDNFNIKDAITILRAAEFIKLYYYGSATYKEALVPSYAGALRAARRNHSDVKLLFYNVDLAIETIENFDKDKIKEISLDGCVTLDNVLLELIGTSLERQACNNESKSIFL